MMKKKISIFLLLCMVLTLCACGGSQVTEKRADSPASDSAFASLEPVAFVAADSTSKGAAGQMLMEYAVQRIEELSDGKLTVDYHPNGELGGDTDLLRQMQTNDIQLTVCQTAPMVSFIPEMAVFDLPMVFSRYDGDRIHRVLNGENAFSAAIASAYENSGFHCLGFLQNATYRLTTANSDLSALKDFQGLQIRTMENKNHMAFWRAIGAEPTPLAWAEVYVALQNGTIDAEENAADTCVGANFQEVQKYLACTNHILYCNQVAISKAAWDALDPAYQAVLEQAVADAIAYMRPRLQQIDQENKALLVDGGMTLIEYDNNFYDAILSLDGVQKLYREIDEDQANGLGALLVEELGK